MLAGFVVMQIMWFLFGFSLVYGGLALGLEQVERERRRTELGEG